ncbi:MAG: LacI family transcriptional regulator [Firmicutes bacterium]|nr:LacI family transcriptional regulator [Bacillota bacterium]
MVTQRDVAQKAGVSFITVSRVLNNNGYVKPATREKVLKTIKELNYYTNHIGRALHVKSVNTIGIIIPAPANVTVHATDYYNLLLAGIEKTTMAHNFDLLLSTYGNDDPQVDYLRLYFQRKVDGLILITPELTHPQFQVIAKDNIPCVIIGDRPLNDGVSYVDTDNFGGICQVTEYLIKKGHRQIGFVKGADGVRNARDRFEGFQDTMRKKSLPIHDDWIFDGNFTLESGRNAVRKIISAAKRPSALICANDLMALGALSEAKSFQIRVPQELAIVGFDGIGTTAFTDPPLSTVIQPLYDMGVTASEILFRMLKDPKEKPSHKIFPVQFLERRSS